MSIVDGKGLITWEGGLFAPDSALLPRVRWAFEQIRGEGGTITLNEAGRPFGVPSDQYARSSQDTESGLSTVWYQWGRYKRGETPSAANPAAGQYASEHTQGIAIDCNAAQPSLRAKYFAMVGLENTIASESWHWAIRGPSRVDLTAYAFAGENATPITEEWDEMASEAEVEAASKRGALAALAEVKNDWMHQFGSSIDNTRLSLENTARQQTMDMLHAIGSSITAGDSQVIGTVNDALAALLSKLEQEQAAGLAAHAEAVAAAGTIPAA